jgi:glyoxylase-like metal-dependent hydrolase (beta-lactamase superfamily II)
MIFKQLIDYETNTYTYIIADEKTREALIIDPVFENAVRDEELIVEL